MAAQGSVSAILARVITSSQDAGTAVRLPAGEDRATFAYVALLALGVLDAAAYSVIAPVAPTLAAQT